MRETNDRVDSSVTRHPIPTPKNSDEEYVARIAKSLQKLDRWRWGIILFHVAILGAVIWLSSVAFALSKDFVARLGNQNQIMMVEMAFPIGIALGLKIGLLIQTSLSAIIEAIIGSRSERLLVKYFDQCHPGLIGNDDVAATFSEKSESVAPLA